MASPKSPTAPVVRTRFWTNLNNDHLIHSDTRNKRDLEKDIEEADAEWAAQTTFPNVISNQHMGRSFESDPMRQDAEFVSKTTKGFGDYENSKLDENGRIGEYKRSPGYKLTSEDLRKNQELSRKHLGMRKVAKKPVVLYVEVKSGMWPVRGARVEATVTKGSGNDTNRYKERFELLDSGSGGEVLPNRKRFYEL